MADEFKRFLSMKKNYDQKDLINKLTKDTYAKSGFTEEQTNSILNISSQIGANLSFINCNVRRKDSKLKSTDPSKKGLFEYSPKYPIK
mmetsp:Transcript_30139/g.26704  ORF Transcript_30139/g.26704 Transcript_30139/m.26704 type:complete len:88 (-) Transcript_30139:539-802(-)